MTKQSDLTDESTSVHQRAWSAERERLYSVLLDEGLDAESLNQLLVERGTELLDAAIPYLVVAARNRARSTHRRDLRRRVLEQEQSRTEDPFSPAGLDPADVVVARSELDSVVLVLGQLDPRYSWPLWWHAAGFDDAEIVGLWNEAGFEPRNPSPVSIRKRRERARTQIKARLGTP